MAHSECASDVCEAGVCVSESVIAYASPTGSSTSACTHDMPCLFARALAVVDATRHVIKLLPGTHPAPPNPSFAGNFSLDIYGPATIGGPFTMAQQASGTATVLRFNDVSTMSNIYCNGFSLATPVPSMELNRVNVLYDNADTFALAVGASHCKVALRESRLHVTDISSPVLGLSTGAEAVVDRSELQGAASSTQGAALVQVFDTSRLQMFNSILRDANGGTGAVIFSATPSTGNNIAFSTFYNAVLKCPSGNLALTSNSNIYVNEASGAPADTVTGTACKHDYDLIKPQTTAPTGTGNIRNNDPLFANKATGDFHLLTGSPAIDAADPSATEAQDFDGTSRPQGAGRDIGAFEYK